MSETMKCKRHKGIDAHGCIDGVWLCAVCCIEELTNQKPLPTPDAPQVTFPDGCAADPIKTFEGYPGIQVDAPQVERFDVFTVYPDKGAAYGDLYRKPDGSWVRYTDYASLRAERDRARSAYRDQHAKTLFEHARAERAEAENKELRAWQSGTPQEVMDEWNRKMNT